MIIKTIITLCLAIPAFFLAMRHNIHMFQLNGYKTNEHIAWLKKNLRQQWILIFALVLGLLRFFLPFTVIDILQYLTLALIILVYRAMKRMHNKKKLVYTARVKRMIATDIILSVLVLLIAVVTLDVKRWSGVLLIVVSLQLVMILLANILNQPMEKAINRHYIRDAQKKLRANPELTIIGVTGSYGKTSMKFFLQTLLQEHFNVLVTPESFNTPMGIVKTIRASLKNTHEIFVCEMGARYVGEIKEICDIVHPSHGVITSIGPQHLETFLSLENIQKTKFELADALPEGGLLFLNGDNTYIQEKAGEYAAPIFYYSETTGQGYQASNISVSPLGTSFTVTTPQGDTEDFHTRLVGAYNVSNILGAISIAHRLGVPLKDLIVPVRRIQAVEHRMQMKNQGNVTIIDDAYNSNPVGSKAAVETLSIFDGVRILITPGMVELGDKEDHYNYQFGTYAADCCDHILLVGEKHTLPIREGALSKGFPEDKCRVYAKVEDALADAFSIKTSERKYILLENDLPDNY